MDELALRNFLLATYPKEDEACEWKEFKNLKHAATGSAGNDIASYVSAIANMNGGHLVIGVEDATLKIVGIQNKYNFTTESIKSRLVLFCANINSEGFRVSSFIASDTGKEVWVFHIPKHRPRLAVYAHGRAWQRVGESLAGLREERLLVILAEPIAAADWTARIVDGASISDLDDDAISTARDKFKEKNASQSWKDEVDGWDIGMFLDKAKITTHGKITRAAILLLGKPESVHFLSPHPAQITWKLLGEDQSYEHFGPPFIRTTTDVLKRIRNVPQRLFPNNQLLAIEIQKYDTPTILEALHNCLAHQDYDRPERILVTEKPDRLTFENAGSFIEGKAEDYFRGTITPRTYRNRWLADAMVEIKMIDTMGFGISRMTKSQRKRFLPLPDYSSTTATAVVLEVLGRPIDERYTQLLLDRQDLDIDTVILLDRVQKKLPITDAAIARLRRDELIEGRKPNFHVSASVAAATETQASYTRKKGVSNEQLRHFVVAHIKKFGGTSRDQLEALIIPMLPAEQTDKQKRDKVKNLLSEMRRDGIVVPDKPTRGAVWSLLDEAPAKTSSVAKTRRLK